ncbi:hypothetical protein [Hymenobacter armeniacus]|uniref:DUF3298 domain-containing protein n=1 Tax=Hymenobacter armeniacus TaxID=2771358 RepID=A0ABR8JLE3_9BACT|nr:hypothetical protein [Hymenobacter armeniacus]MBD2720814.1 hypothetical protein [Hymenobacter armeniacus]
MKSQQQERYQRMLDYEREQAEKELVENAHFITAFQEHCKSIGITLTNQHFSYITPIGIVATYPNLVAALNEELKPDKDRLYDFMQLKSVYGNTLMPGVMSSEGGKFMLLAHPYFRRGFHEGNNFAPDFLEKFWRLKLPSVQSALALDPNRVRVNMNARAYMEKDTWMGAAFNSDIASIPDGLVQLRPSPELDEWDIKLVFANTHMLDVRWSTDKKGVIKTFEAEEFKTIDVSINIDGVDYFPARYIHAEFELNNGNFRHLDGAIHLYTYEEYTERIEADLRYNAKNDWQIKAKPVKLFRIDGVFNLEVWAELISHFFTGDPLIHEYFEGKYPEHLQDWLDAKKQQNL